MKSVKKEEKLHHRPTLTELSFFYQHAVMLQYF